MAPPVRVSLPDLTDPAFVVGRRFRRPRNLSSEDFVARHKGPTCPFRYFDWAGPVCASRVLALKRTKALRRGGLIRLISLVKIGCGGRI